MARKSKERKRQKKINAKKLPLVKKQEKALKKEKKDKLEIWKNLPVDSWTEARKKYLFK